MKIHSKYLQIRENTWKLWQKWYSIKEYKKKFQHSFTELLCLWKLCFAPHIHILSKLLGFDLVGACVCVLSIFLWYWSTETGNTHVSKLQKHTVVLYSSCILSLIITKKKKRDRTPMGIKNDIWEQSVICHYSFWHANINTS